jgi:protein O-mannosyl-transferase
MTSKRVPKKNQRRVGTAEAQKPTSAFPSGTPLWQVILAALAIGILVVVAYSNSIGNGFVWDDHEQIVMNPYMKPGAPLAPLFTSDVRFTRQDESGHTKVYRPLQLLTYRLVEDWFGGTQDAFHICSVLFAIGGALTAFAVFWLLTRTLGLAFAAAALFAVHPIHTEAVDWIAALPDLGFGLFALLAFALFLLRRTGPQRWILHGLSLLSFAIALLWKETAIVFPAIVATYAYVVESGVGSRTRRALVTSAPYWIVLAAYLALRAAVLGTLTTGPRDWALTPVQSILTMLYLMLSYWVKLALPFGLNAYHLFHPICSLADPRGWAAILLVFCAVAGIAALIRRAPLCAFAALWVCIYLVPAMNFNGLGRNPFAERYLYLPSVGFCLLVLIAATWPIERLPENARIPLGAALLASLLVGYIAKTVARNPVWKDDNTLFAETLLCSPDAPFVRYMVATAQSADPTTSGMAEQNYLKTIALSRQQLPPDNLFLLKGYEGLTSLYADRGQFDQAQAMLSQARAIAPNDPDVIGEEGMILARMGHGSDTEASLTRALAAQPNNENVLSALGVIAREEHHDLKRAEELFLRALAAHPQDDDLSASQHNNLAAVYADQGNFLAAIKEIRRAIRILPKDPEFHVNLANALAATGHFADGRVEAESALRIAPDDTNAREVLEQLNHLEK